MSKNLEIVVKIDEHWQRECLESIFGEEDIFNVRHDLDKDTDDYVEREIECVLRRTEKEEWYILVGDDSGHEYVIPESKLQDWDEWVSSEEAEDGGDVPEYAQLKEGHFRFKKFEV